MKLKSFLTASIAAFIFWGCSTNSGKKQAHISGKITVADSVDASKDYAGIGLTIIQKDSANANADTLFHAITDSTGFFSGMARFQEKRQFPLIISRNDQNLVRMGVILAAGDSVKVEGQLPNLGSTISISSNEHEAMETFRRVDRNFQRVAKYIQSGIISGDSLEQEMQKWSDLYWQVYNDKKGTIASELAAYESIQLLQGWNNEKMMEHIRSVQDEDELANLAASYGKNYIAHSKGLTPALLYLDTLSSITEKPDVSMRISMERIKLLYDSARIDAARKQLQAFQKKYSEKKAAQNWVESVSYDINYLSPGDSIPSFQFKQNARVVSRDSLLGAPYILEITGLANSLYQEQFDRTVVIHSIYKHYGLNVVTLPLDQSQITIDAFFEERVKPWPVADAQSFDRQELLDKFNIQLIPTRFLVDQNGKIVRKYVGREYEDVISGIQTLIKQEEPTS